MTECIENKIREILREIYGHLPSDTEPLELDSMALIVVIEEMEQQCGMVIDPSDLLPENFYSVEAILSFAHRKSTSNEDS